MHLTPRDLDKLLIHQAGVVAQKRLARGLRLNYPEAIALIATQLLELIREGKSVGELMDLGRRMLGRVHVMDGVAELVAEVQVEGTFPDGSKLVTVHHPVATERGDLKLCLHGSFLPVPPDSAFPAPRPTALVPGEVRCGERAVVINEGRVPVELLVTNLGDRPIQVGSHYHFSETNRALSFDRKRAYGHRLDVPAGTAVRFEPGERKTISLVPISGNRVIRGGNALLSGKVNEANREEVSKKANLFGFAHDEVSR